VLQGPSAVMRLCRWFSLVEALGRVFVWPGGRGLCDQRTDRNGAFEGIGERFPG